jgi:hypothetical protein
MTHQVIDGYAQPRCPNLNPGPISFRLFNLTTRSGWRASKGFGREKQTAIAALDTTEAAGLKAGQFRFRAALRDDHWPTKTAQHGGVPPSMSKI